MSKALALATLLVVASSDLHVKADERLSNDIDGSRVVSSSDPRAATLWPIIAMFGRGYNSITGKLGSNKCVKIEFDPQYDVPSNNSDFKMKLIRTAAELTRETSAEAEANAKFLSFSAEASSKLREKEATKQLTDYLIIKNIVQMPPLVPVSQSITNVARKQLQESPQDFHRICGDSYVSAIELSAEFFAVLSFESNDSKKFQQVEASLEAAVAQGGVKGSFKQSIETAASNSKTEYRVFKIGGHGSLPPADLDSIIEYAIKFPGDLKSISDFSMRDDKTIIDNKTEEYSHIDFSFKPVPDEVTRNVRIINNKIEIAQRGMVDLERVLVDYQLLDIPRSDRDLVYEYKIAFGGLIDHMKDAKEKCGANPLSPNNCKWPDNVYNFNGPSRWPEPKKVAINVTSGDWQRIGDTADKPYDRRPFSKFITQGWMCFSSSGQYCSEVNRPGFVIEVRTTGGDGKQTVSRYDAGSGPFHLPPGLAEVRIMDSRYDDNRGEFEVIIY